MCERNIMYIGYIMSFSVSERYKSYVLWQENILHRRYKNYYKVILNISAVTVLSALSAW